MLVDNSALDVSTLSEDDLRQIMDRVMERDWTFPPRAIAIVASSPSSVEAAQRTAAHAEVLGRHRRVFSSQDEALDWLRARKSRNG
jgi:hypothetical protein